MLSTLKNRGTFQKAANATGDGRELDCSTFSSQIFEVSGTFVGTIIFEGQISSVWIPLHVKDLNSNSFMTSVTTAGAYRADISGYSKTRARISSYTSGNITVTSVLSSDPAFDVIPTNSLNLPFGADYMAQSNADSNGNYQTIIYKTGGSSGVTVKTITLTYDASGNVLTYSEA